MLKNAYQRGRWFLSNRSQQQQQIRSAASASGGSGNFATNETWSEEWRSLGFGTRLPEPGAQMTNLLFVQTGFGVDQHGNRGVDGATKAAVRAVRNAIEFNSIPGMIEAVPGGRKEMLIQVKLGIPTSEEIEDDCKNTVIQEPLDVDLAHVAKVFPYGRLMPIQVVVGGLSFPTGRIVHELGDENDVAICVAASVSIGYDSGERTKEKDGVVEHKVYDTRDGY
uniref:Uncharacterized protein n=1 Tax=Chaetoceros debilis TaxID=122233 RepID=A0A7S3QK70_9STRA|mmetsp:Transcript_6646/g.9744  ORF Transcript_6646/g.9744 Transcript_6646/m.9744 type:complete len:223 (+) Transcript_6646:123-791(+)